MSGDRYDSQNVSFWSEVEGCYVCYYRTLAEPGGERTIGRATSDDYIHWNRSAFLSPHSPGEHLYTNQTHPYFRAPHIYIAFPTRFIPERNSSTDILFMATRAGSDHFERLFSEAIIRPGPDPERWGNRSNYVSLNVVPTGPTEISIYHKDGHRYVFRTDGFVSIRAGAEPGEMQTRPFVFSGAALELNVSTSAAGSVRVELQDREGRPLPGFALNECSPFVGDVIDHKVHWQGGADLSSLAGHAVRMRLALQEADVYSFRFAGEPMS
jgi:hypothetical protein